MSATSASKVQYVESAYHNDIAERRTAHWLQSKYPEPCWTVSDTRDQERTATIDFRFLVADGRLLTEVSSLYATVKEYAWWLRDPRFSRIDDAQTHATMVRNLMGIAHALSLRNIWTFAHLQPYDIEQLIEDCRFGVDGVLHASERVEAYLTKLATAHAADKSDERKPFGGLPQYVVPSTRKPTLRVDADEIVAACNLPPSAGSLPRVRALIGIAGRANGLSATRQNRSLEPLENQTVQAIQRWLDPLEQIYAMRRRIEGETLSFKPFAQGAARVAAVKGVGTVRTPTPPPKLALHLLEHATRLIFDHGDLDAVEPLDKASALRLATACWILVAAFSARRDEEIDELCSDCLRGDERSGWWLHTYIEKTLQRKEWIPVPLLVAQAVHTLQALSAGARIQSGSELLFQWLSPNGEIIFFDCGRTLDEFASTVGVPPHRQQDGSHRTWHWHPHQFRRFFAILYFYRFEGASIEALSHHLRHFSLEMTRRYVTQDPEVAALWTDVEWGYMGHVARSIAAGERSVSGAAGTRLKKLAYRLLDLFRRKLQVISPDRVGAALKLVMQRQGMVLTPKPWVTCSCPSTLDAAAIAACRRQTTHKDNAIGPDFAHAGPTVCSACPHAITQAGNSSAVDSELSRLESVSLSKPRRGTLFGELEDARLVELHTVRKSRYEFESQAERGQTGEEST